MTITETTEGRSDDDALILAALDEAAEDRTERASRWCTDCTEAGEGPCADQREHLDRASEYRELRDRLEAGGVCSHPVTSRCECGGLARHIEKCGWRQGYGSVVITPPAGEGNG